MGVKVSIDRIRAAMRQFQGEPEKRTSNAPSRKLRTALHALDSDLTGQSAWLANDAEWRRAGLRVGAAITEGTANVLVNRRMNKSQQMRWPRRGAVCNGTPSSGFGRKFLPSQRSMSDRGNRCLNPQTCDSPVAGVGDSHDNALAETINGLLEAEVIYRRGPWRSCEAVELAILGWVDWFNNRRFPEPIGNIPPAEAEAACHAQLEAMPVAA